MCSTVYPMNVHYVPRFSCCRNESVFDKPHAHRTYTAHQYFSVWGETIDSIIFSDVDETVRIFLCNALNLFSLAHPSHLQSHAKRVYMLITDVVVVSWMDVDVDVDDDDGDYGDLFSSCHRTSGRQAPSLLCAHICIINMDNNVFTYPTNLL